MSARSSGYCEVWTLSLWTCDLYELVILWTCYIVNLWSLNTFYIINLWSLWTFYILNLLYHELWTCSLCDLLSTLLYYEVWYIYRLYFRFRPLPVYFPHQTFVSDVSEIPISFPFPKLPFSILFPIKKYENGNGFSVYRPFPTVFFPTHNIGHTMINIWIIFIVYPVLRKNLVFVPLISNNSDFLEFYL
jgi:hypothetical protein